MAHRLHCQFLLFQAEILIVTDELLVELSEGEVRDLEFRFDEFGKGAPGVHVGRHCRRCTVHADTGLHLLIVPVEKFEQGHLHARVTLEHVPDRGGIEILFLSMRELKAECTASSSLSIFHWSPPLPGSCHSIGSHARSIARGYRRACS